MLAYNKDTRNGYRNDPTIQNENGRLHPQEVNEEKQRILEPCILDIEQRCKIDHIQVIGLLRPMYL